LNRQPPVKILLAKLNHLGDTLLLTPTIHFLKERFPEAEIDALVRAGCEEVLRGNPDVHQIFSVGHPGENQFLRNPRGMMLKRYDYAFDLSDSGRAKLWILLSAARMRGINDAYHSVGWQRCLFNRISVFEWRLQHQVLRDFRTVTDIMELKGEPGPLQFYPQPESGNRRNQMPPAVNFAVIHPTSRWAFKQWLPERWAAVADEIRRRHNLAVIFSTGPAPREVEYVRAILGAAREKHAFTEGKISLHELGRLLQQARLFCGVDTVAMHLAAAMQTPTVALFGPSSEWSWRPWQCRHELVLGDCSCKATRQFVCDKSKPYPCMQRITIEAVLAATGNILSAK
jgi:heptosyltransferase-3